MSKQLVVVFSNGEKWAIPAEFIARNRALCLAVEIDGLTPGTAEYNAEVKEEIEYALSDDYEIIDWARGNMNWSDLKGAAKKIATVEKQLDYESEWISTDNDDLSVEDGEWLCH